MKLICIPFSGGNIYSFAKWQKNSPSVLQIKVVELPGRGLRNSEALLHNVDAMADDILYQINEDIKQPYAIYGHSLGAIIAFELTHKLIKQGKRSPEHLFLSGKAAPKITRNEHIHLLPRLQFFDKIYNLGGTPVEIIKNQEIMNFYEPILRADIEAAENYNYSQNTKLKIPFDIFQAKGDSISIIEANDWASETIAQTIVHFFEGNHFFILSQEKEIIDIILKRLSF